MKPKQAKQRPGIISVTPELKSQILAEMLTSGSVIPKIAKSYNLSPKRLYNWRDNYRKAQNLKLTKIPAEGFVELEPFEALKPSQVPKALNPILSQISLTLGGVSLSVNGNLTSLALLKILEALESC